MSVVYDSNVADTISIQQVQKPLLCRSVEAEAAIAAPLQEAVIPQSNNKENRRKVIPLL